MNRGHFRATLLASLAVLSIALAATVSASPAGSWGKPIRLDGLPGGWTEPRIVVGPDGTYWAVTNATSGVAVVYSSRDSGKHWSKTPKDFPGQQQASADTDIAVTPTGRVIATELDGAALKFVTAYSDDRGQSWQATSGTSLADTDRPWLAVGPTDAKTHKPRVYLLFHNLLSGALVHEMYVSTSTDNGATFGAPVPIAPPGSQALLDLQCGDSGAPSALAVNTTTGQLYAVFGTRTSALGGCGASALGTFEINVVGETRVWVATSPDGSLGSWTDSLAFDGGSNTVSASFETAAVDRTGNVFVAFAETAKSYPSFDRASIRYVWAASDLGHWSSPVTVTRGDPVGTYDPTLVTTGVGRLALAYYQGETTHAAAPTWTLRLATVSEATSPKPHISHSVISARKAYQETADTMGGSCSGSGPLAGVQNGFICNRANDDFGLAIDHHCRLVVVYPMVASLPGTWVATQRTPSPSCRKA